MTTGYPLSKCGKNSFKCEALMCVVFLSTMLYKCSVFCVQSSVPSLTMQAGTPLTAAACNW